MAALAALLLLPWAIVAWRPWTGATPEPPVMGNPSAAPLGHGVVGLPGPWGQLETVRINTEPPEDFAINYLRHDSSRWVFQGFPRERVSALFRSAGLGDDDQAELLRTASVDMSDETWVFHPSEKLLLSLSPKARAAIYLALSREFTPSGKPLNLAQQEPFRWRADDIDGWFEDGGVADGTVQFIRRLLYYRGRTVMFSDVSLVLPRLAEPAERLRLLKTLSRQSTLMVKLRIRPDTDVDALVDYWGRGVRSKDIRPLLDSLKQAHSDFLIDIVHLLPRFARKRLYNYPSLAKDVADPAYDCHWSSMNFWNDPPDDRFGQDLQYVQQVIDRDYCRVNGDYMFGDVLLYFIGGDQAIHSAVYIAADIVFTKNGPSLSSPWIFMDLARMQAYYETYADLEVRAYRRKDLGVSTKPAPV